METSSYHMIKSTRATATKKIVEANVMNIFAKFQLHPPMTSEEKIFEYFFFFFFFANLAFR